MLNKENGGTISKLEHKLFNDLHSIVYTGSDFLVTSSGADRILKVTQKGEVTWEWSAVEHCFNLTPLGKKKRRYKNWNTRKIPTNEQVTHMNSATLGKNGIIASLFHQGMVIKISEDGSYQLLLRELSKPHAASEFLPDLYVCANANAKEILIFDNIRTRHRFIGRGWIQNLTFCDDGFYFIDADYCEIGFVKKEEYEVALHDGPYQETSIVSNVKMQFDKRFRLFDIKLYG